MIDINEMQLKDILEQIGEVRLQEDDFTNFCNVLEINQGFKQIFKKYTRVNGGITGERTKEITKYILDNEQYIDKEKLLFCIYLSHRKNVKESQEEIEKIKTTKKQGNKSNSKINLTPFDKAQIDALKIAIQSSSAVMENIVTLTKNKNIYLIGEEQLLGLKVFSSREIMGIESHKKEGDKKSRKLEKMELRIDGQIGKDFSELFEHILISDLLHIMPTRELGEELREKILCKCATHKRIKLDKLSKSEYEKVLSDISIEEYSGVLLDAILNNTEFIDLDKLLLILAYRIQDILETGAATKEEIKDSKVIISEIINVIKNKDVTFKENLENKNTKEIEEIEYSYQDLEDCFSRFKDKRYVTKQESEYNKQNILTGIITLEDSDAQYYIKHIKFTEDEINKIMLYSEANFKFFIKSLKLNEEDISKKLKEASNLISKDFIQYLYENKIISIYTLIDLYRSQKISLEFFKEFSEENSISSENSLQKINEKYLLIKMSENTDEEEIRKLNQMIEVYKIINLEGKTEEEIEEESNNVMYELAENFEQDDILFYYENGLVTLQTVIEWIGHTFIQKLYNESKMTFADIEELDIDIKVKQAVLGNIIISNMEKYDQDTLLNYINKGYLSEDNILSLYKAALLNSTYADDMLNSGIISVPIYLEIYDISKETLEKQTDIKSSKLDSMGDRIFFMHLEEEMEESEIELGGIPLSKRSNIEKEEEASTYIINESKSETLINPALRWAFLRALKCKIPADDSFGHRNPESPFYNYDFFIIENEDSEEAQKDSIIIGERFYKDKATEYEFATLNATYIWQYKDYLIAKKMTNSDQKKNKKAITKETEGVVYVANHRAGSWAVSLLYKIAQAKAGESFDKYKKGDERATKVIEQLEKLYSQKELQDILEMARILDNEEKVVTPEGNEMATVFEVTYDNKKIAVSRDDDDDAR